MFLARLKLSSLCFWNWLPLVTASVLQCWVLESLGICATWLCNTIYDVIQGFLKCVCDNAIFLLWSVILPCPPCLLCLSMFPLSKLFTHCSTYRSLKKMKQTEIPAMLVSFSCNDYTTKALCKPHADHLTWCILANPMIYRRIYGNLSSCISYT